MYVFVSDLHIAGSKSGLDKFPVGALKLLKRMINEKRNRLHNNIKNVHLVLLGDIFDLNRSSIWLDAEEAGKPVGWQRNGNSETMKSIGSTAVEVFEDIEKYNVDVFDWFRETSSTGDIIFHYIPGNHDALVQFIPELQDKIRNLFGIEGEGEFRPDISDEEFRFIALHGHQFDDMNYPPDKERKYAPFGDFVTVFIATMPEGFARWCEQKELLQTAKWVRTALPKIDHVRPASAAADWLEFTFRDKFDIEESYRGKKLNWEDALYLLQQYLAERLARLLRETEFEDFLHKNDKQLGYWDEIGWLIGKLKMDRLIKYMLEQRNAGKILLNFALGATGKGPSDEDYARMLAARMKDWQDDGKFAIMGHTHRAMVLPLFMEKGIASYYINTGTFRRYMYRCSLNKSQFDELQKMTILYVVSREEDDKTARDGVPYFDIWTGHLDRDVEEPNWRLASTSLNMEDFA